MAAPWIVGLASGAGALGGLVVGGFAGTKLAGSTQTPDQQTAAVALGAATGMFLGAFALGALVAEPGPGGPAAAGTAGIPKGLGGAPVRRFAAINSQLMPASGVPVGMGAVRQTINPIRRGPGPTIPSPPSPAPILPLADMLPSCAGDLKWVQVAPTAAVVAAFAAMPPAIEQIQAGYQPYTVWTTNIQGASYARLVVGSQAPVYYECMGVIEQTPFGSLPDARLGFGTNDMAEAYGVGAVRVRPILKAPTPSGPGPQGQSGVCPPGFQAVLVDGQYRCAPIPPTPMYPVGAGRPVGVGACTWQCEEYQSCGDAGGPGFPNASGCITIHRCSCVPSSGPAKQSFALGAAPNHLMVAGSHRTLDGRTLTLDGNGSYRIDGGPWKPITNAYSTPWKAGASQMQALQKHVASRKPGMGISEGCVYHCYEAPSCQCSICMEDCTSGRSFVQGRT